MIEIHELRVVKDDHPICAVDELSIEKGARVAIVGPNGSGKTTLLRVLAGLEPKFSGNCRIDAAPFDRVIAHQSPYLFRGTVLRNVCYGLAARRMRRAARKSLAREWLDRLNVGHLAGRNTRQLSGGEARRVALVRALILRPQLLLLDEPLAELDQVGTSLFASALGQLAESTILMTSPLDVPAGLATQVFRL